MFSAGGADVAATVTPLFAVIANAAIKDIDVTVPF